jgi:cell division protein FtsQ
LILIMALGALLYKGFATAYRSAPLELKKIQIEGNSQTRVSNAQLEEASGAQLGAPLLKISTNGVASHIRAVPWIAGVQVERLLPSTLRIVVTERRPWISVLTPAGPFLVDPKGVVLQAGSEDLVQIQDLPLGRIAPGERLTTPEFRQASIILSTLPGPIRASVSSIKAPSIDEITLQTYQGQSIFYGAAEQMKDKNFALASLLTSGGTTAPGTVIDVRVPNRPSVRTG